jgi:transposase
MEKIGIDVHKVATQVCILNDEGDFVEFRIRTEREALTKAFAARARARILLEAATESEWVARHLEALCHEVIVADPNFAPMYASRSRKVKTDKRAARAVRGLLPWRVSCGSPRQRCEPDAAQAVGGA